LSLWILGLVLLPPALGVIFFLHPWTARGKAERTAAPSILDRAAASGELTIQLTMEQGRCRLGCNGIPVGDWPDALKTLSEQVSQAGKRSIPVLIDTGDDVPHRYVVDVVDECMRYEVPEIRFAGALPGLRKDRLDRPRLPLGRPEEQ
jgi:hypothetical protein